MSQFSKLLRLLEKEVGYQEDLLQLLVQERVAIVKLNQEELETVNREKEKLVARSFELESQRQKLMSDLSSEESQNKPKQEAVRLRDVLTQCAEEPLREELSSTGDTLRSVAESVKQMNEENGDLIRRSLGLISTTIAIMQSQPQADLPAYSQRGKLTSDKDDSTFSAPRKNVTRSA